MPASKEAGYSASARHSRIINSGILNGCKLCPFPKSQEHPVQRVATPQTQIEAEYMSELLCNSGGGFVDFDSTAKQFFEVARLPAIPQGTIRSK